MIVKMKKVKETKRFVRFSEGAEQPRIGDLYVRKEMFEKGIPEEIEVEIKEINK